MRPTGRASGDALQKYADELLASGNAFGASVRGVD